MSRAVVPIAALALVACSASASPAASESTEPGRPFRAVADGAEPTAGGGDAEAGDAAPTALDAEQPPPDSDAARGDTIRPDSVIDDPFTRPAVDVDYDTTDSPADIGESIDTDAGAGDDTIDSEPTDLGELDDAPDIPPGGLWRVGYSECLRWEVVAESLIFDFKEDDFLVSYFVSNRCAAPLEYRVPHLNDFFPMAIHKDGELWTYLGVCPGGGAEHRWTFGTSEGVRRAFRWNASEHESLLDACGSEAFDPDADYTLVGYGLTELEIDGLGFSEVVILTDPIPIVITD